MAWWTTNKYTNFIGENLPYQMMQAGHSENAEVLVCDLRWVLYRRARPALLQYLRTSNASALDVHVTCVMRLHGSLICWAIRRFALMPGQFLLNALRKEPVWAQQAIAVQTDQSEPTLISHWPLPDNPGPALRHVYKIPVRTERNDAVTLSPDGAWLAMANDIGLSFVDTATGRVTESYELLFTDYYHGMYDVSRITVAPDGSRIAILSSAGAFTVFDVTAGWLSRKVTTTGLCGLSPLRRMQTLSSQQAMMAALSSGMR